MEIHVPSFAGCFSSFDFTELPHCAAPFQIVEHPSRTPSPVLTQASNFAAVKVDSEVLALGNAKKILIIMPSLNWLHLIAFRYPSLRKEGNMLYVTWLKSSIQISCLFFAWHFARWTKVAGEENLRQDADEVLSVGAPSFVFPNLPWQMWWMCGVAWRFCWKVFAWHGLLNAGVFAFAFFAAASSISYLSFLRRLRKTFLTFCPTMAMFPTAALFFVLVGSIVKNVAGMRGSPQTASRLERERSLRRRKAHVHNLVLNAMCITKIGADVQTSTPNPARNAAPGPPPASTSLRPRRAVVVWRRPSTRSLTNSSFETCHAWPACQCALLEDESGATIFHCIVLKLRETCSMRIGTDIWLLQDSFCSIFQGALVWGVGTWTILDAQIWQCWRWRRYHVIAHHFLDLFGHFFCIAFCSLNGSGGWRYLRQYVHEFLLVGARSFVFPKLNRQMWRMYWCCNVLHGVFVGSFLSPWFCRVNSTWSAELLVWSPLPWLLQSNDERRVFFAAASSISYLSFLRSLRKTLFDLRPNYGHVLYRHAVVLRCAAGLRDACCRHARLPASSIYAWNGGHCVGQKSVWKIWSWTI